MKKPDNLSLMEVGSMMHVVFRLLKKRTEEINNPEVRISVEQMGLLHALSMLDKDVIQKDMAELMEKDKSAILRLIDTLEKKELVRRAVDAKDRRKNYLIITKLGNRVIEQYMKIAFDLVNEIQQGLDPSEIATFRKVVGQIRMNAERLK